MQELIVAVLLALAQPAAGAASQQMNSSNVYAQLLWIAIILVVVVCLVAIGFASVSTGGGPRRRTGA
jgi:hypothetical protein